MPVSGNRDGGGKSLIGVLRASTGQWYLNANGNVKCNECGANRCQNFGQIGDLPIAGDWRGDSIAKVGVFRAGSWYLDNGNGQWDGCGVDTCVLKLPDLPNSGFGLPGNLPAVGRW